MPYSARLLPIVAAAAALLFVGTAQAQETPKNYWFLKAVPMLKPVATAPAQAQPTITLSEAVLPEGMQDKAYSFDLKTLTTVTGGEAGDTTTYGLGGGTLPTGISLSNDGMLAGTPTAATAPEGASFTVTGSYLTATGQQAYTIKVGESVLQVTQMSAGGYHTCAVTTAGGVKCWGRDLEGQLGNDTALTNQPTPVDVLDLTSGVASVAAGGLHTCAVTSAGGLKCWGYDAQGQLGNDADLTNQPTPVNVLGLASGVARVEAGDYHTCAVATTGSLKCWGHDTQGQLGNDAATTGQPTPVNVKSGN